MHRAKGSHFELIAERFLIGKGLRALQRNFNCKLGEIDLIMEDGEFVAFIEVKYRESIEFGTPLETITPRKRL
ncbi:MAG: YraN family protein [Gammaproteobacteria bacterium]|nr:YraN family protein [Gammaproteobacteria bacterium]